MAKQLTIYLIISLLVIIFHKYFNLAIFYIDTFYNYINFKIAPIFSHTYLGIIIRKTLILMIVPILITLIPAIIYRVVKGNKMPYFMVIVWFLWFILALNKVITN